MVTLNSLTSKNGCQYGIVGDGRVARHVGFYFDSLGIPARFWSRKFQSATGIDANSALQGCTAILILTADQAIEALARELSAPGRALIHFSGSLVTPLAQGFHPLMTFGPELYESSSYEKIPFIVEKGAASAFRFRDIFPDLKNPFYELPSELKARYHALCVLSGNFTTLLWAKVFGEFDHSLGIPAEALLPYMNRIQQNLAENTQDPLRVLTGPIARGDRETIEKNLRSLEGDPYQNVYRSFVEANNSGVKS